MSASIDKTQGFTLIEMLVVLAIVAILATLAWPAYQKHIRQVRLNEAKAALLTNSQALERFFSQNHSFKVDAGTWMSLPITQTEHFCLRLQGNPRNARTDYYTLKAVAFDHQHEPRVILINQDLTVKICGQSSSRCDEANAFFRGGNSVDRQCKIMGVG